MYHRRNRRILFGREESETPQALLAHRRVPGVRAQDLEYARYS